MLISCLCNDKEANMATKSENNFLRGADLFHGWAHSSQSWRSFILICSLSFEELLARCWEVVQNFSVKCDPFSHSCIWEVRLASLYIATYLCSPYVVLISIILPPHLPDASLERRLAGKFSLINPVPTIPSSLLHIPPLLKAELLFTWTGFKCMPGI